MSMFVIEGLSEAELLVLARVGEQQFYVELRELGLGGELAKNILKLVAQIYIRKPSLLGRRKPNSVKAAVTHVVMICYFGGVRYSELFSQGRTTNERIGHAEIVKKFGITLAGSLVTAKNIQRDVEIFSTLIPELFGPPNSKSIDGKTFTPGRLHINCPKCGTGITLTKTGEIEAFVA